MPAPEINIPALCLPTHLRLGTTNWKEYKQAIETVCRIADVDVHLTCVWLGKRQWSAEEEADWKERDELCKAIITLNIRDFSSYGVSAGRMATAEQVWTQLNKMHAPKRWCGLLEWVRPFTRLEVMLLGVICCLLMLFRLVVAEMRELRLADTQHAQLPTIYPPSANRIFRESATGRL